MKRISTIFAVRYLNSIEAGDASGSVLTSDA
jgi:hypothetical protein